MTTEPNPFKPPEADLGPVPPPEKGSAIKAVFFGFLADVGLTMVIGAAFMVAFFIYHTLTGTDLEALMKMISEPEDDSTFTVVLSIIGGFGSALGGYVCARVARHSEYRLGAILIVLSTLYGLALAGEETSPRLLLVTLVIAMVATMFGTWVGVRRNRVRR